MISNPAAADTPLLTISIPTYNRAAYLALNLAQLRRITADVTPGEVEIVVLDNASPDNTRAVVDEAIAGGLALRYIHNGENIGSDRNIAKSFNVAQGRYVMILGDDDLICDDVLPGLLGMLHDGRLGVVSLRPYGYDNDFRAEDPGGEGRVLRFADTGDFLARLGPLMTLISGCVVNRAAIMPIDANDFIGGNLVQVHLVLLAALACPENALIDRYAVACKRNNSGGYDFSEIFVTSFTNVLDERLAALGPGAVRKIENAFLLGYYPYYLLRQRLRRSGDLTRTEARFAARYRGRGLYEWWAKPILTLPRPLAIIWGAGVTLLGRLAIGDLRRGLAFTRNKLFGAPKQRRG
jgi:abequosyltransferase